MAIISRNTTSAISFLTKQPTSDVQNHEQSLRVLVQWINHQRLKEAYFPVMNVVWAFLTLFRRLRLKAAKISTIPWNSKLHYNGDLRNQYGTWYVCDYVRWDLQEAPSWATQTAYTPKGWGGGYIFSF